MMSTQVSFEDGHSDKYLDLDFKNCKDLKRLEILPLRLFRDSSSPEELI